jgi:eukaryotic-like serine/threonine-protein kinase
MLEIAAGTIIADRYRLTRQLGEGGMGSVWAAEDEKLRRAVAVKLVTERIADSERALARFEREAMSVARLRSPYIAQVYDYGVEDGSPYIIMELLEGEDLKAMLTSSGRLTVEQTAGIVVPIAKALHAAHNTGIVHRDLKPANVFLAREHGEEVCKVFDFGVAKALNDLADDSDATAEGVLLGTPRYMSPEQAHGAKQVDHRSDLWGLGVIAYLCLTGRLPFVAVGTGHVLVKICTEEPPSPSELVPGFPAEVDEFFRIALAKDADARFQSAREMGTAFAGLADMSLSSFTVGSRSDPRPSWGEGPGHTGGDGSDPLDFGGPSISIQGDASITDPGGRSQDDGTLGPATTSVAGAGSWLATKKVRVGAALAALLAVGVLGYAIALRSGPQDGTMPAASSPALPVEPAATATADDKPVPTAAAAASSSAGADASGSAALDDPPKKVTTRRPKATKTPPAPAKTAEPAAPPPPPPPKGKGDGLDLFNKRF